jgi:hypothetical protein
LRELIDTNDIFAGSNLEVRLNSAYKHYKEWCRKHHVGNPIKKFMYIHLKGKKGHPTMWTQRVAKAAQMKHIVFWLRDCCAEVRHLSTHNEVRASCFDNIVLFEAACAGEGRFVSAAALEQIENATENWLQCYLWLNKYGYRRFTWHMVPKFHMTTHVGYDFAAKCNPRRCTCYSDEDLVGKVKRIMERCHGASASKTGLRRYQIWVTLRWWVELHHLRGVPLD